MLVQMIRLIGQIFVQFGPWFYGYALFARYFCLSMLSFPWLASDWLPSTVLVNMSIDLCLCEFFFLFLILGVEKKTSLMSRTSTSTEWLIDQWSTSWVNYLVAQHIMRVIGQIINLLQHRNFFPPCFSLFFIASFLWAPSSFVFVLDSAKSYFRSLALKPNAWFFFMCSRLN